jgi:glycosyltransferase involved in cell wall biosynthesis
MASGQIEEPTPAVTTRITCVLSAVLGNRTFSTRLADAVDSVCGSSRRLWFNPEVYRKYPAGPLYRRVSAWESVSVARRWLAAEAVAGPAIVNGYGIAMSRDWDSVAVATDATPAMLMKMTARSAIRRLVLKSIDNRFRRLAKRAQAWLPVSNTVKSSLVEDYEVPPERCFVTRMPQLTVDPTPHEPSGRLLFVGNDFERKGGIELLEAFRRKLLPDCTLTVVSNDPAAKGCVTPNVEVIAGIHDPAQIADIYRRSDLLVLPTRYDCYSYVICEAASFGVPSVATRVGGVGELLDEAGGVSLSNEISAESVAATVRDALTHGYHDRAVSAAEFARTHLTYSCFVDKVREVIALL